MLSTPLCHHLGITYPLFSVGMAAGAGPELAAAVSNAGACGVLGGTTLTPTDLQQRIARVRALTNQPFGVNIILARMQAGLIETCVEARVPLLVFFWGDPTPYVAEAHRHGITVVLQVGSVEEARAAVAADVDVIMAQGCEAGGHVKGTVALTTLVPEVVEAVHPVPVIAAGGIATGRGVVAALSLGAQAVSMGTRFLASAEARVPHAYKERVVQSTAKDTVYTGLFDVGWAEAPHRVLRNKAVVEWEAAGRPARGQRPGEGQVIGTVARAGTPVELVRYSSFMPIEGFTGDLDYAALYAGESCSLVNDIKPAAQIVADVMRDAEEIMTYLQQR
jgi:NAD(P)H-dependent flavin oxidoreductase YrpB (nitropropane dioxygenase family)